MNRKLYVFFHSRKIGDLSQDSSGQLSFSYDQSYLEDKTAQAISLSLALEKKSFNDQECRAYFAGLLPEDLVRRNLARYLKISEKNDFSFLEVLGGDCAGAVALSPEPDFEPVVIQPQKLTEAKLKKIFSLLNLSPLLSGEAIRLSLAGAQNKLALLKMDGAWYLPGENKLSTHIIKPAIETFPDSVFNEYFCLQLAKNLGINVVEPDLFLLEDKAYLVLDRYDREIEGSSVVRMHQEDFCQILAITPDMKYQSEGGIGVQKSFELVEKYSSQASVDKINLLNLMIFNLLIGNHDAHAKNFSILYQKANHKIKLAPFYDLLSTVVYPSISPKMAMKFGDNYKFKKLNKHDLRKFIEAINMSKAFSISKILKIIKNIIPAAQELASKLNKEYPSEIYERINKIINHRAEKLLVLIQDFN